MCVYAVTVEQSPAIRRTRYYSAMTAGDQSVQPRHVQFVGIGTGTRGFKPWDKRWDFGV